MSDDDFVSLIEVHCKGRRLHLRRDQLTVANLSKLSNIAPDTIYLISDDDFVALPDNEGSGVTSMRQRRRLPPRFLPGDC